MYTLLLRAARCTKECIVSKIKDRIDKFNKHQIEMHQQDIAERRKYLEFCENEAERIYDALTDEILDDIELSGKAFVNVDGRFDNIFKCRILGLVAEKFRDEGLEIKLFNSIGIVKIYIDQPDCFKVNCNEKEIHHYE